MKKNCLEKAGGGKKILMAFGPEYHGNDKLILHGKSLDLKD
jgi:hypothetical protein